MAETTAAASEVAAGATPEKKKKGRPAAATKKLKSKPSHPPTSTMVNKAIGSLKERGGSSLQAIKKYITANYKVDADKMAPFIKKYLKNAVESGTLVRTKGKGAAGSFKLEGKTKTTVKSPAKKAAVKKSPKKTVVKKAPAKKAPATPKPKKAPVAKKTKAKAAKPKSPSKAKKTAKPPTKPKTPKAKRGVAAKSKAIKKTKK